MDRKRPPLHRRFSRFFSADGFAMAPVGVQLVLIVAAAALLVFFFSPLVGSLQKSFRVFLGDPEGYVELAGRRALLFGLVELIVGLCIYGFVISILTSSLIQLIQEIRGGALPYRRKGHLLLVNENGKIPFMLTEMNDRSADNDEILDVVIMFPDRGAVRRFQESIHFGDFPWLRIFVRQGNPFRYESYERLGVMNAHGLVILLDCHAHDEFQGDNRNVKILSVLVNQPAFRENLLQRFQDRHPFKFAVEMNRTVKSREIVTALSTLQGVCHVSVITPIEVISRILARAIVDIAHYKIFYEILSFYGHEIHFIDARKFFADGLPENCVFEEIQVAFQPGILIGISRAQGSSLHARLAPFGERLVPGDWLIFLAKTSKEIIYTPCRKMSSGPAVELSPPEEIACRRICMVGRCHRFSRIDDFLDEKSRALFRENIIERDDPAQYFDANLVGRIRNGGFDHVIVNLDDETALRFTLYVMTLFGAEDPFLSRIITVIEDPVNEEVLSGHLGHRNTILSEKMAAKYITQISFQKNLDQIYGELTRPEGFEFNLLDIDREFPRQILTDLDSLKGFLLARWMIYVGSVQDNGEVIIGDEDPRDAVRLIVLSEGTV